jgi:hypothetical protein
MSNTSKNSKNISSLSEAITTMVVDFIQSQEAKKGRISIEAAVEAFQAADQQKQMKELIKTHLPAATKVTVAKRLKDENAPKRAKSGYMFYCDSARPEAREANPDMKMTEISKVLGAGWQALSDEEKAPFIKKADKDKKRYLKAKEGYTRPADEDLLEQKVNQKKSRKSSDDGTKAKRKKKEKGSPKNPVSAYLYFCSANRAQVKANDESLTAQEVSKELGRMWKEDCTSEEDRAEFVKLAAKDKKRFLKEKAAWEAKKAEAGDEAVEVEATPAKKRGRPSKADKAKAEDEDEEEAPNAPVAKKSAKKSAKKAEPEEEKPSRKLPAFIDNAPKKSVTVKMTKKSKPAESADSDQEDNDESLLDE